MRKDHKNKTKSKFYVPFRTSLDISFKVPVNIIPEQWRELVEYWGSKEAEEIATRNSKNRKLRGITHKTGRKHFSQIHYEMKKMVREPIRSVSSLRHRKDDPEMALLVTQFNEHLSKVPEHLRTTDTLDQIFCEMVGKDGKSYCQTYSSAVSALDKQDTNPSYAFNLSTIIEIAQQVKEEVKEKFRLEIEQLKARITFLESHCWNVDVEYKK
ncbi:uncharacterized protein LOC114321570 [Camellia sinensis]|uniref:uncharacterized protein LOC114321570 n=1 Tax=Camellia sinensis TaxID=4442 RepID=UPI001035B78E|nr:uncharacterized protein LOC114321570 [Camellia sinensis]XP_028124554.1 uncharacterized protein LOC114321570 [Camellia sinensis]